MKRFTLAAMIASGAGFAVAALAFAEPPPQYQARTADAAWWTPDSGRIFPRSLDYADDNGVVRTLLADGPMETRGHPFFSALGPNGRACVTCHQPADGMSLSLASVQKRWVETGGHDPVFAAIDGSNCPDLPQGERASHSLLLDHGLIRIERAWPPRDMADKPVSPDFRLEVVRDPTGCNSGQRGPGKGKISVYRRPRPVSNLKYLTAIGFAYDPKSGMPLKIDPETGKPTNNNLLADARLPSLAAQAREAMQGHLGMIGKLSPEQVAAIVAFESRLSTAQAIDAHAGALDDGDAEGGPAKLEASQPGQLGSIGKAVFSEFEAWEKIPAGAGLSSETRAFRESVARGAHVFRDKTFLISDSSGINAPIGFGNPVRNSCVFCHNMSQMGNDVAPGQVDLGVTTQPFADPAPHLPLFRITCLGEPHPFYGRVIYTSDPGYALTTGKCADVGKITLQSLRGLSARAPYFSNGSAKDLRGVIDYYDRRYAIGYTEQEKQDLVNLLGVL